MHSQAFIFPVGREHRGERNCMLRLDNLPLKRKKYFVCCYHGTQVQQTGEKGVDWIYLVQDRDKWRVIVKTVRKFQVA